MRRVLIIKTISNVKHPAKYSDQFIPVFAEILKGRKNVLDPFAGTCKITNIREHGYQGEVYCNEIEPEWLNIGDKNLMNGFTISDAESLPYKDNFFEAICTSPTYGNRMADSHNARDDSKRNTYTHTLGRKLHPENTGQMQWGEKYKDKHIKIWNEMYRLLQKDGILILNISNHIRKGEEIDVTDWHIETLMDIGFELEKHIKIETKRNRQGANGKLRVAYESIVILKKK